MKHKGFTLIELLVVIAMIAILVSIIIANLYSAWISALEAKMVKEINSLQNGLELYYLDNNRYPSSGSNQTDFITVCNSSPSLELEGFKDELEPYFKLSVSDLCYFYADKYELDIATNFPECRSIEQIPGQGYVIFFTTHNKKFEPYHYLSSNGLHYHCIVKA